MKGIANAFGIALTDDRYDFSFLSQFPASRLGCSVVFYPGEYTEDSHSILSRNYDFTTGTFQGKRPQEGEMAVMSRPYIFELYPDQGYASVSICAFDLLGGVLDGINSEGVTVAILADDETVMDHGLEPFEGIGLHELMSMRYVLDTCKDVEEAKEALLSAKHYYSFIPCHYIIADANGNSFVFEFSSLRNATHCIDGHGPQWVTNHLLSKYSTMDRFPEESMIDSFERYRMLHDSLCSKKRFSIDDIKAINASVASTDTDSGDPNYAPHRTLWHSLYDLAEKRVHVKFYLEEREGHMQYSDYMTFQLEPE
jgi:predicted choloylglycine hydrolase